jgi:uncharacterized repeat protein (TIGR02543 family)
MLNLEAKPEDGYGFANWTGDVDSVDNVNADQIIITVNDDYSLTANFEEKPPVNWALLGGIIAITVVGGLVIYLVRTKRLARTKGR